MTAALPSGYDCHLCHVTKRRKLRWGLKTAYWVNCIDCGLRVGPMADKMRAEVTVSLLDQSKCPLARPARLTERQRTTEDSV